jgi:Uma2 family endonuclease
MSTLPTQSPGSGPVPAPTLEPESEPEIDYESLVTEDHKPVDRIFIEKLYRLLTHALYASWPGPGEGRPFLVLANVGWFYQRSTPAVVPDVLLSLGVTAPPDLQVKQGHSYYQWDLGKQPDVIIGAVSDRTGGEESFKKNLYARLGVPYYAVFDPKHFLSRDTLRTYELSGGAYRLCEPGPWPTVGLGLRLWQGRFEGCDDTWLRWCDASGEIIPTGEERVRLVDERARLADERTREADERARLRDERIRELEAELRRLKGEPPGEQR